MSTSADAAELVDTFKRPTAPASMGGGAAILDAPSGQHGKCKSCGKPVLWFKSPKTDALMPLNPPVVRAALEPPGVHVMLVLQDGTVRRCFIRDDGHADVLGRGSHFATCPSADQHRKAR